jgi:hypothetical protein
VSGCMGCMINGPAAANRPLITTSPIFKYCATYENGALYYNRRVSCDLEISNSRNGHTS